ncbi:MAG: DNA mismatch repair protein MutS, partial [Armatimonadetes bacterium]|nr:DNA mismatch repair protein MutS [Armatimonadota bacterium]
MSDNLTPLFRQYWEIKKQYPDVLLLFRLGDFYETFYDDATVTAQALDIVLTSRPGAGGERVPMAGIPFHAAERYVARLIAAGHRVAICDQVEDPRFAKGLVRRKVTRVVTPGTVLEDSMLEAKANNFLVAAVPSSKELADAAWGLAVADVSTGEFAVTEVHGPSPALRLLEELERLAPRELLLPERAASEPWLTPPTPSGWTVTPLPAEAFPRRSARETLLQHLGVQSLRGFGCEEMPLAIEAAAVILGYLHPDKVGMEAARHLRSLTTYSLDGFMVLDATARRNLEVTQALWDGGRARSLLGLIDCTATPMGARLLRRWLERPLLDPVAINARLDAVEQLAGDALRRGDVRERLQQCADLERLASRAATGTATPRDLGALRRSLALLPELRALVERGTVGLLQEVAARLELLSDLHEHLCRALVDEPPPLVRDGGIIRPGYSPALDDLRRAVAEGKEWIANLEATERERTGIKSLKVGYNAVFGYYIEVTRPNVPLVPANYHRKQTTANAERYITPELKEQEATVTGAEEKIQEMEAHLFAEVRDAMGREAARILAVATAVAELDALAAFAETSVRLGFCRPVVDDGPVIELRNGRHPVVEKFGEEPFVPNDGLLDDRDHRLLIITGPNMAGKSTYLRQVALIVLLAQAGCFVPADAAHIGIVDRIFTRVGAHDDLASGQSTFMVEMTETASILHHATERSLVILDEIGRGTSTYDGLSNAWAEAEHLQQIGCKTLFATHYHHLNDLADRLPGVKNYRVAVKEEGHHIVWLRKIVPGGTDRSYGIQVARLAGLPDEVIARAREVLTDLEAQSRNGGVPSSQARIQEKREKVQLTLFEPETDPVRDELRALDLTT